MSYSIYGITGYDAEIISSSRYEVHDNYTLIASGDGAANQNFDVSPYDGFAIIIDDHRMAINKLLLGSKALYTDSSNALILGNFETTGGTYDYSKAFKKSDSLKLQPTAPGETSTLAFTTRGAKTISVDIDGPAKISAIHDAGSGTARGLYRADDNTCIVDRAGLTSGALSESPVTLMKNAQKAFSFKNAPSALVEHEDGSFSVFFMANAKKWSQQKFAETGYATGKAITYKTEQLSAVETQYMEDIDGNGTIGTPLVGTPAATPILPG